MSKRVLRRKPFIGELARAFLIVNGLAWIGVMLASPNSFSYGAPASARIDRRTGQPRLEPLAGCEIVETPRPGTR